MQSVVLEGCWRRHALNLPQSPSAEKPCPVTGQGFLFEPSSIGAGAWAASPRVKKKRPQRKGDAAGAVIPPDACGGEASGRLIASRREAAPALGLGATRGRSFQPPATRRQSAHGAPNSRRTRDASGLVGSA